MVLKRIPSDARKTSHLHSRVNQTTDAIDKEHVDHFCIEYRHHFARSEGRVRHYLTGPVSPYLAVWLTGLIYQILSPRRFTRLFIEPESTAFRASDTGNRTCFGQRFDGMPEFFFTGGTEFFDIIADHICLLIHLIYPSSG